MLYRPGTMLKCDGGTVDYMIVDACDIAKAVGDGWFLTIPEALTQKPKAVKPKSPHA